jgi:predicted nucleic acid-binding protein
MKVLCDANILVRAAMSPTGPAAAVLGLVRTTPHQLICSNILWAEVRRILSAERMRRYHGLDDATIAAFHDGLLMQASFVVVPGNVPSVVPDDPLDDHVVFAACADALCTLDTHLHAQGVVAECALRGIRVLTDVALLTEFRAQDAT